MAVESSATAPDLATNCFTCKPLETYVELTGQFVDKLADALQSPMLILFASLAGLWIVLSGFKIALRHTDINTVTKEFIYVSITGVLVGGLGISLISYVYTSAISIMGGSSAAVFALAANEQTTGQTSGLVALAANGELAVYKVFQAAQAIVQAGSLYNMAKYVYAIILVVPYFLLVVAYSSQVVVAIFRATMVAVFGPFLFMAFAFGWGRGMAAAGAKTLLASVLVLFACTASLSLAIYGVNQVLEINPAQMTGDAINEFASISNPKFLVILFLGWMGTALQTEGTAIANSIAQTALTNAGAGILTAGASGSALLAGKAGKFAGKSAGWLAGTGGHYGAAADWFSKQGAGWQKAGQHASDLVDKFKNINRPDAS